MAVNKTDLMQTTNLINRAETIVESNPTKINWIYIYIRRN